MDFSGLSSLRSFIARITWYPILSQQYQRFISLIVWLRVSTTSRHKDKVLRIGEGDFGCAMVQHGSSGKKGLELADSLCQPGRPLVADGG